MFTDITVGDIVKIQRIIKVIEIDNVTERIKIEWNDKFGNRKDQWVTFKTFLSL